jgi:hypothetical protein
MRIDNFAPISSKIDINVTLFIDPTPNFRASFFYSKEKFMIKKKLARTYESE